VQAADSTRPAGFLEPTFGQRIAGRLIDGLITGFAGFAVGQVVEGLTFRLFGMALFIAVEVGFLLGLDGQTLGKRAVGTRVMTIDGAPVGIKESVVRSLVLGLSVLTPISLLVLLPAMKGPLHRGVHDWLAGTVVTSTVDPRAES
jgi:uncharacterized RDD family membrane protein YckC